jgi:tRNA wybutosine-synthesizing protein 2
MQNQRYAALVVSHSEVKQTKVALESHKLFDKSRRIEEYRNKDNIPCIAIPTLIPFHQIQVENSTILKDIGLSHLLVVDVIALDTRSLPSTDGERHDLLRQAAQAWLETTAIKLKNDAAEKLLSELPTGYMVYPPMLLLSSAAFTSTHWLDLLSKASTEDQRSLYSTICSTFRLTHLARNSPIPLQLGMNSPDTTHNSNIMRSPVYLTPLHGDFGPPAPILNPTADEFKRTFWVTCKQNGIEQVWAPLHTMFSRGNVTEKARVLEMAKKTKQPYSAVDLYAGIGYFTFSYAMAGASTVLGWEINPWSVEGMRRGAERNRWSVEVIKDYDGFEAGPSIQNKKLVVFQMDNSTASGFMTQLRASIAPVKHVNCGLLPTSKGSWKTAIEVLDPVEEGWIHLHENFRLEDIPKRSKEVVAEIQSLLNQTPSSNLVKAREAKLEHVQRVKSYAPGIIHCVVDIFIHIVTS